MFIRVFINFISFIKHPNIIKPIIILIYIHNKCETDWFLLLPFFN